MVIAAETHGDGVVKMAPLANDYDDPTPRVGGGHSTRTVRLSNFCRGLGALNGLDWGLSVSVTTIICSTIYVADGSFLINPVGRYFTDEEVSLRGPIRMLGRLHRLERKY